MDHAVHLKEPENSIQRQTMGFSSLNAPLSVRQSMIAAIGSNRQSPCIHAGLVRICGVDIFSCSLVRILAYPSGYVTKHVTNMTWKPRERMVLGMA